jgi:hypothetical protein
MPRHGARFGAISAVKRRLPAARPGLRKVHLPADSLQNVRHGHANLGEELVDHAGNKQRHPSTHGEVSGIILVQKLPTDSSDEAYFEASLRGWLPSLPEKLDALRKKGFRMPERHYRLILQELGES